MPRFWVSVAALSSVLLAVGHLAVPHLLQTAALRGNGPACLIKTAVPLPHFVSLLSGHSVFYLQHLRINEKMLAILSQVKADISKVKLGANGSYVAVPPEPENSDSDSEDEAARRRKRKRPRDTVEVEELSPDRGSVQSHGSRRVQSIDPMVLDDSGDADARPLGDAEATLAPSNMTLPPPSNFGSGVASRTSGVSATNGHGAAPTGNGSAGIASGLPAGTA